MYKTFCYVTLGGRRMLDSSTLSRTFVEADRVGTRHVENMHRSSAVILDLDSGLEWCIDRTGTQPAVVGEPLDIPAVTCPFRLL